ncbi:MAG: 3-hydroxyacyl-CoA dehydrogenase family protein [Actinobacteria bacterium]|nr:3-hydroxyacyl-CoA dehydrogenase family protein [Actinomycetota bacterium]
MAESKIQTVGVLGCGTMGAGISEVSARAGYKVIFKEVDEARVEAGYERIRHSLSRAESSGKIERKDLEETLARIQGTSNVKDLADADLVIEAIPEKLEIKRAAFSQLEGILKPEAILATNTSSLPVIELGVATNRPQRVVGIHFFNPAPVMELVELVKTVTSTPEVLETARIFVESLGKTPVVCRDRAGFIANLLLFPYLNEAVKLLEGGFATREDIDAAMRFGAGHPIGPLALLDLVGLDSCAEILESLYRQFEEPRFAPSPMFRHLVSAGYLGRKTGRGFYTYEEPDSPSTVDDDRSGRVIQLPEPEMEVTTVGVVGTGTMGAGLVEVAAKSGLNAVCWGRSQESLDRAKKSIEKSTSKAVERGKMTDEEKAQLLDRITWSTDLGALGSCQLILESVAEDIELKKTLFTDLDKIAPAEAILASGTSSLPVVEMAAATSRPEKVLGVHFFNPANLMRLVELVRTVATSGQTLADVKAVIEKMGKHPVFCEDRAGFIVNRLLFPYLNDAVKTLDSGYASAVEIDTAMKLGCRHPMGPFELIDLVGLDVTYEILRSLHAEFREPEFRPAPLLEYLVKAGNLGRKSGRGFYPY